jgi:hypothetical protein
MDLVTYELDSSTRIVKVRDVDEGDGFARIEEAVNHGFKDGVVLMDLDGDSSRLEHMVQVLEGIKRHSVHNHYRLVLCGVRNMLHEYLKITGHRDFEIYASPSSLLAGVESLRPYEDVIRRLHSKKN